MKKPRLLSPGEAGRTLVARLGKVVDRGRQIEANLGLRPYQVFLVWTTWQGVERGEGHQRVVCRTPLLPVPIVDDLSAISKTNGGGGQYPTGTIRLRGISQSYNAEILMGRVVPDMPEDEVPQPFEFFYEIVGDGRTKPVGGERRWRFQPTSEPFLDAEAMGWTLTVERTSGDMANDGNPVDKEAKPKPPNPWRTMQLEAPPEDDDY